MFDKIPEDLPIPEAMRPVLAMGMALADNVKAVRQHILTAGDAELNFLEVSPRQRDLFGDMAVDMQFDAKNQSLGISPYASSRARAKLERRPPCIDLSSGAPALLLSGPVQKKMIAHEFGHFFQDTGDYLPARLTAANPVTASITYSPFGKIISSMTAGFVAAGAAGFNGADPAVKSASFMAGYAVTLMAINYPVRLCEHNADKFADLLLPEVSFAQVFSELSSAAGQDADEDYSFAARLLRLIKSHPSDRERSARSDANRPRFLAHRQMHGMPSLVG